MRLRLPLLAALAAVVAAFAVTAATATAAPSTGTITAPITNVTTAAGTLNGAIQDLSFAVNDAGQLVASGVFNGTVTSATGVVTPVTDAISNILVNNAATSGGCQILDLTLGPLDLNLLGLVVHLDTVHLNITAQPGPGNLLGNLLCSVTHLLDNGNSNAVQNLLNILNGLLGGL
jgi:hypothetical protein